MRLNLFIARSGYASRRKADALIKEGRVKVNCRPVKQPFFQVTAKDEVRVEGSLVAPQGGVYIIFNKPKGITVTLADKFADKKIIDYLPPKFSSNYRSFKGGKRVYPAGRLDKNSQGLIILTNDGKLCYRITHPKFAVEKEYLMKLNCRLSEKDCRQALRGVKDEGDFLKVKAIEASENKGETGFYRVIILEGKKRHLRRLFKRLGFKVTLLKRVRIGRLCLGNLREGAYRLLDRGKIYSLLT